MRVRISTRQAAQVITSDFGFTGTNAPLSIHMQPTVTTPELAHVNTMPSIPIGVRLPSSLYMCSNKGGHVLVQQHVPGKVGTLSQNDDHQNAEERPDPCTHV